MTTSAPRVTSRASSTGPRVAALLSRLGHSVKAVAEHAGIPRTKLSTALNGGAEMRLDWLEAMPVDVVREYLRDMAARVGMALVPMGDADSGRASVVAVVSELADVQRHTAMTDADGLRDPAECVAELREVREAIAVLRDREAALLRAIEMRGEAVA